MKFLLVPQLSYPFPIFVQVDLVAIVGLKLITKLFCVPERKMGYESGKKEKEKRDRETKPSVIKAESDVCVHIIFKREIKYHLIIFSF